MNAISILSSRWALIATVALAVCALPAAAAEDVPPPPGIEGSMLTPHMGEALQRANMTLEQVIESLPRDLNVPSSFLPQPGNVVQVQAVTDAGEPPLSVQRLYAHAREAWRQGQRFQAREALEAALTRSPDSPGILRMLAQMNEETGNRAKAAIYLRRSLEVDASDVVSALQLGQYELERGRGQEAIAALAHAWKLLGESDEESPQSVLVRHFLATALGQQGHDGAAVKLFRSYLEKPAPFGQPTRSARDYFAVNRRRGTTWQTVGDSYCRLGQWSQALEAFEQARAAEGDDAQPELPLLSRLIYCQLRLGKTDAARQLIVQRLGGESIDNSVLALVQYVSSNGVDAEMLATELTQLYERGGKAAHLALAVTQFLPPAKGRAMLAQHLAAKPTDRAVLEELAAKAVEDGSPEALAAMLKAAGQAIVELPAAADRYGDIVLEAAKRSADLLPGFEAMEQAQRDHAGVQYLRGRVLTKLGRDDEAAKAFEQAMAGADDLLAARAALVDLLVERGDFEKAEKLIEPLADRDDPATVRLRVKVLKNTGQRNEAIRLLNRMIAAKPMSLALVFEKADLQLETNDALGAEQTLIEALNAMPMTEEVYERLLDLYDNPQARIPDAETNRTRLVQRLVRTLPQSRLARMERAKVQARVGQLDGAQREFKALLDEDPGDGKALLWLGLLMHLQGQTDDAIEMVRTRAAARPNDDDILQAAQELYLEMWRSLVRDNQYLDATSLLDKALQGPVANPQFLIDALEVTLQQQGKEKDIDAYVERALKNQPKHEADILFRWAMVYEGRGERARAEEILLDLLEKHPRHPAANNSLGYGWANAGKNLAEAERMIRTAVEAEPDTSAYVDSLGWVLYKQGKFEAAAKRLGQAVKLERQAPRPRPYVHPVIQDHYGDALYRLGKKAEALEQWRAAQNEMQLGQHDPASDPELETLPDRLERKVRAAQADKPAPVAPAGDEPAADDPAADADGDGIADDLLDVGRALERAAKQAADETAPRNRDR